MPKQLFSHKTADKRFDDQAGSYDRWYTTPLGRLVDQVEKEALFSLLPPQRGRRLLEVGCGTGNITLALARQGAQMVGLDHSHPMLAAAVNKSKYANLALAWLRGQAPALPFEDESFDGVICVLALDFISAADRPAAVNEMVRVLRPGGFLTLAMLNRYSLWTLKRVVRSWFRPSLWRGLPFISPRDFNLLLLSHPELHNPISRPAVYFPPWEHRALLAGYAYLEHLGQKFHLPFGAFLAATAWKRKAWKSP